MKVLHCIHSLSGGGAERQLGYLLRSSENVGIDSAVSYIEGDLGEHVCDYAICYRSIRKGKLNLTYLNDVRAAIREFKPDVVHVWLPEVITIPAMIGAFLERIPCVFSFRNAMKFHRILTIPEYLTALFLTRGVLTNNPVQQSSLLYRLLYSWKHGVEIRNAVEVDECYVREQVVVNTASPVKMIFVGRLTAQKNWQCLLRSLVLLELDLDWRLTICGDGEDRSQIEDFVRAHNLQTCVTLAGYQKDIHNLMSGSDLMILPSWHEGMPNVVLEAFSLRLPCLVSAIDIHRDITADGQRAVLFDPASPADLARKIQDFVRTPESVLDAVGKAYEYARTRSPQVLARDFRAMYQAIITRGR